MIMPINNKSLLLTIAEIRFNSILNIPEYLPAIQDSFSMAHYPDFSHIRNQGFQLAQSGPNKSLMPTTMDIYQFSNYNKSSHFRLNSQCLTYQSSNYKDFETFLTLFLEGLFIVNKILNIQLTERVGLRFIDRLMIKKGESIQKYLAPQESSLFEKLGGNSTYTFSEVKHQIKDIHLFNRVKVFQNSPLDFPNDIEPGDMVFKEKFVTYKGPSAIIDTDAFIQKRSKLTLQAMKTNFYELHDLIIVAFEASVSDIAKKVSRS